jgi:type IV fimbrial biogenesis protein FimT
MQRPEATMKCPSASGAGFTLIELMVTLAVAAVLLGLAVPAFNDLVRERAMSARINDLVLAVSYARSEAVRRGATVTLQAADPANDWSGGYCVVVGDPGDCNPPVLRSFEGFEDMTLIGTGALADVPKIRFNARGLPDLAAAETVALCSRDVAVDSGRVLHISRTGRVDVEQRSCGA